ncbi:MAG: hypothetical protein NXI10_10555 [bacterium]|nr:hypothetical protein [bacterium]
MQKRFLVIEILLFATILVSWFFPYAHDITPWYYMVEFFFITWQFVLMVTAAMFTITFVPLDLVLKSDSKLRKPINGLLLAIYAVIIGRYFYVIFKYGEYEMQLVVAVLFSLLLFLYSFLIQKGTSFTRNIVICIMSLPIVLHMIDMWSQLQTGGILLNVSFVFLVLIAIIRPFLAPKIE